MRLRRLSVRRLLAAFTLALACAGAAAPVASAQALAADRILRRGNGAEPATLDTHRVTGVSESNILRDLYEGLVVEAADGALVPGAAERWEISSDGKTYTFHLRAGGRWSNGDPVTAQDFVIAFRRGVNPATASDYAFILAPIANASAITSGQEKSLAKLGVSAPDARTLKVRLNAPTPYFLQLLTHSMANPIHSPSLAEHGDRFTRAGNLVSNGPYLLAEWTPQSRIVLKKSATYRDAAAIRIEEVHYLPIEDGNAELRRYRAGEVDMTASVPLDQVEWVLKNLPQDYKVSPYLGTYYYLFNVAAPPFKDNLPLRRALSLAVDRDIITAKVTRAGQIPAMGWVPPGVSGYQSQSMAEQKLPHAERVLLARRLYAEAGYSDAKPLEVEILYNTSEGHKQIAVAIASMWKQSLGVRTRLVNQEWKVYLDSRQQGRFQLARAGWIGDYNDPNTFLEIFASGSGLNEGKWSNAQYDALVKKAGLTGDPTERARLLAQAERILVDELPILPVYFYVSQSLVKPYVLGWKSNILDHHATRHLSIAKH